MIYFGQDDKLEMLLGTSVNKSLYIWRSTGERVSDYHHYTNHYVGLFAVLRWDF
jgi:hypothetical protein